MGKGTPKALEELMDSSAAFICSAPAAYTKPIQKIKTWKSLVTATFWRALSQAPQTTDFVANLVEVKSHPNLNTVL